jgi:FkbM family methyltransferase
LLAHGVSVADWVAFEPDEANAKELARTAEVHRDVVANFTLIRAGLSDEAKTVRFAAEAGVNSRVLSGEDRASDGATTEISVVRLDDVLRRAGSLYVKMDIEGSETDALRGMPQTLRQRPVLAISIYHRPDDLWKIPELVRSMYQNPRMRLGVHCHHAFDTVLYVWPG